MEIGGGDNTEAGRQSCWICKGSPDQDWNSFSFFFFFPTSYAFLQGCGARRHLRIWWDVSHSQLTVSECQFYLQVFSSFHLLYGMQQNNGLLNKSYKRIIDRITRLGDHQWGGNCKKFVRWSCVPDRLGCVGLVARQEPPGERPRPGL